MTPRTSNRAAHVRQACRALGMERCSCADRPGPCCAQVQDVLDTAAARQVSPRAALAWLEGQRERAARNGELPLVSLAELV